MSILTCSIRYIYLEELEEDILKENVVTFLELGEKYEVEKLKELAEAKMLQLLHRDNMVDFLMAGDLFRWLVFAIKNILFLVQSREDQGRGPAAGQGKPGLAARRGQGGAEEAPAGPRHRAPLARLDLHCGQEPIVKP